MAAQRNKSRLKRGARWLAAAVAVGLVSGGVVGTVGDFGFMQRLFDGIEHRALHHQATRLDRWGLQVFYATLRLSGRVLYPQAATLLTYYCEGQGDTLHIDARPLLRHPEVQQALRLHKPGITFRHQQSAGPFYVARRTDWGLYYAFDLLYIRQHPASIVFYDNYFFQPLARRSYTRFRVGRMQWRVNDGLIRVAYPRAKSFIIYGKVAMAPAVAVADNR